MSRFDTTKYVSSSSLKHLSGTLISRISGVTRDIMMAFFFGTSAPLAAFFLAYRFIYLLRRLFGESLLHQGFIPHFEKRRTIDPKGAALFFRDLFWTLTITLIVLIGLGEGFLSLFHKQSTYLAMWMLPGVLFLSLFGLTSGLLNAEKSFFIPAASPAAFNLIWICGVLALARLSIDQAIWGLSMILSGAFFAQFMMTLPSAWSYLRSHLSLKEIFQVSFFSKELNTLIKPLLLGVIGVAAVQIGSAIDGIFARFASREGPAYLWYAIRMQQLPLALFAISYSSALLPSLSRAFETGEGDRFNELITFAKRRVFLFTFLAFVGIIVLGASSVNILFGRGDFTATATHQTILCLWSYGIGLVPMALVQIFATAFYAKKDYKTPAMGFVYATVMNIFLNGLLVFYFKLGSASIALATSFSALFNLFYLLHYLPGQNTYSKKVIFSALLSGAAVLIFGHFILGDPTLTLLGKHPIFVRTFAMQLFQFLAQAVLFFGLFFGIIFKIGPSEVDLVKL